jgi:hypothetical protein
MAFTYVSYDHFRDSGKIYASLSGWADINLRIVEVESFLHSAEAYLNLQRKEPLNFTLLEVKFKWFMYWCALQILLKMFTSYL